MIVMVLAGTVERGSGRWSLTKIGRDKKQCSNDLCTICSYSMQKGQKMFYLFIKKANCCDSAVGIATMCVHFSLLCRIAIVAVWGCTRISPDLCVCRVRVLASHSACLYPPELSLPILGNMYITYTECILDTPSPPPPPHPSPILLTFLHCQVTHALTLTVASELYSVLLYA